MSMGELLLIAFVALFVFGPDRMPTLARQLGTLLKKAQTYRQQLLLFWDKQEKKLQLEENQKKADKADAFYK